MPDYVESYDGNIERKVEICKSSGKLSFVVRQTGNLSNWSLKSFYQFLLYVFLPQGYPHSVSDDYLNYQKWDTLQAFASSITGALATEAVLRGAGVGNDKASALATALTWLVKDGLGMIGRIAFTYFRGTDLDCNPKKWRLVADILNDFAFFLDLLSPAFPNFFLPFACTSSLFRCVVGVAGGATRTSIVQHQALRHNLADVAAKDGSQETLVNVAALISSLTLLPLVSGKYTLVWCLYLFFTIIHLYSNYKAVKSLSLKSLNKNRAAILIEAHLKGKDIPNVTECNQQEPLFFSVAGSRNLGCSLITLKKYLEVAPASEIFENRDYIVVFDRMRNNGMISISQDQEDHLLPFYHIECLASGNQFKAEQYMLFRDTLSSLGFDLSTVHLGYSGYTFKLIH